MSRLFPLGVLLCSAGLGLYIGVNFIGTEDEEHELVQHELKGSTSVEARPESLGLVPRLEPESMPLETPRKFEPDPESFTDLLYQSPELALNWLAEQSILGELSQPNQIAYAEEFLARLEEGYFAPDEVVDLLAQFEGEREIFQLLANRVIATWNVDYPEATLAWLLDHGDHPVSVAVSRWYGATLGEQEDVEITALHLVNYQKTERNSVLLDELMRSWVSRAPEEALEFMLAQAPQSSFDGAKLEFVYRNGADQPQRAMSVASGISDKVLRLEAIVNAARVWRRHAPVEYAAWYAAQQGQMDAAIVGALAGPGVFSEAPLSNSQ